MSRLGLVWAQANGGVIGAAGEMPWHVPEDLAHFRAVTASPTSSWGAARGSRFRRGSDPPRASEHRRIPIVGLDR